MKKIIETFHLKERTVFINSLLNLSFQVIPILSALIAIPFILIHYGKENWSFYSLSISIIYIVNFFNLSLGPAVLKKITELLNNNESEQIGKTIFTGFISNGIISFLISLFFFFKIEDFFYLLDSKVVLTTQHNIFLKCIAVSCFVTLNLNFIRSVYEAYQKYFYVGLIRAFISTNLLLSPVIVHFLNPGSFILIGFNLIFLNSLLFLFLLKNLIGVINIDLVKFQFSSKITISLLQFGGWYSLFLALNAIIFYSDRYIVSYIVGFEKAAFYITPMEIAARLNIIHGSLISSFFPAVSYWNNNKQYKEIETSFSKFFNIFNLLGIFLFLIFFFASFFILKYWLGPPFEIESTPVLQILILGYFLMALSSIATRYFLGINKPKLLAWIYIILVPIYLPILFGFTIKLGLIGTALAVLFKNILEFTVFYFFLIKQEQKILSLDINFFIKNKFFLTNVGISFLALAYLYFYH